LELFTIGIVLLPDEATGVLLVTLSEVAHDMGTTIVLRRGVIPHPHLSLFHMRVTADKLPLIRAAINGLNLPARIGGMGYKRHLVAEQWLFLQANGDGLVELQQQVVEAVASLRSEDMEILWRMSPAQKAAHAEYGYPNVGEAWDTHFTYGYFPKPADPIFAEIRAGYEMSQPWTARAIAVVLIGDHGTAGTILHLRRLERPSL
jgi:hypothetical protein